MAMLEKAVGRTRRHYRLESSSTSFDVATHVPTRFSFRLYSTENENDWFLHLTPGEVVKIAEYAKSAEGSR